MCTPSLTNEQLFEFFLERGVHCKGVNDFVSKFDILHHENGILFYRLKENIGSSFLDKDTFLRRDERGDDVVFMSTHDQDDKRPFDILENSGSLPLSEAYKKGLVPDPSDETQQTFETHVMCLFQIKRTLLCNL